MRFRALKLLIIVNPNLLWAGRERRHDGYEWVHPAFEGRPRLARVALAWYCRALAARADRNDLFFL
jgi:hypothetical protein